MLFDCVSGVFFAAVEQATALGPGGLWLDENGLMMYEPSPAKVCQNDGSSISGKLTHSYACIHYSPTANSCALCVKRMYLPGAAICNN